MPMNSPLNPGNRMLPLNCAHVFSQSHPLASVFLLQVTILNFVFIIILLLFQKSFSLFYVFLTKMLPFFLAALGLRCCVWAFPSCVERGLLFVVVCGLLIAVASLVVEHGLQACELQQLWLEGSRAQAQQWYMGLVALWHVGSSRTRDRTHVPCIGRWILNHWTTREVP